MNTKLKRVAGAPVTPAEAVTDYLVDHINAIMICCGIQSIEVNKYTCGFGSRLHVTMTPFNDAPPEIVAQGVVVKDAIAQIMSVVNLAKQTVGNFTKEEADNVHAMWKTAVEASKMPRQMPQQTTAAVPIDNDTGLDEIPINLPSADLKEPEAEKAPKKRRSRKKK